MTYIYTIITGCLVFPFIAALFTLPYVLYQYHHYGSLSKFRTLIIYSFILYMMIAFFMTVLPLPSFESTVENRWQDHLNLVPFTSIVAYWSTKSFNLQNILDYLKSYDLWQLLFNILLTLLFGVYLRYYFKQSFKRTLLFSFLLSLFYELTQLSALYGIYPGPYRLAEVDDLICNTLGGVLGYQIGFIFMVILPSRNSIDETSRKDNIRVTGRRRFFAVLFDYLCCNVLYLFLFGATELILPQFNAFLSNWGGFSWTLFCAISLIQVLLFNGKTLGHAICNITIVQKNGYAATKNQLIKRYAFLWLIVQIPILLGAFLVNNQVFDSTFILFFVTRIYWVYYFIQVVCRRGNHAMPHDTISHTAYGAIKMD